MPLTDLKAGRELDALVAEKVMGLSFWLENRGAYTLAVVTNRNPWETHRYDCWEREKRRYTKIDAQVAASTGFFGDGPKSYSTDIAAAWQVVDKMYELGFHFFRVEAEDPVNSVTKRWLAGFHRRREHTAYWADGDTAPEAICLAALEGFR